MGQSGPKTVDKLAQHELAVEQRFLVALDLLGDLLDELRLHP